MAKQGEIDYLKQLSPEGREYAFNKPYSDERRGNYFMDLGTMLSLMPQPPARVLDLGAGTGWSSVLYAQNGYDVLGQDIAPDMIDLANKNKERAGLSSLNFITSDYESLELHDEFDVAIFYDSLHHSVDEKSALQCAYNALKPGGILITAEPGQEHGASERVQAIAEKYNVTEKGMSPRHIIEIGTAIGFRKPQIYKRHKAPEELEASLTFRKIEKAIFRFFRRKRQVLDRSNFVVLTK